MTKGDFLLKDGKITIKFLPRIRADDQYGGYAHQAKSIGRYFREEYDHLRCSLEQPGYFREQLIYNYIYKGPILEWYLRIKLSLEKSYANIHEQLPLTGKILDLGCGYGFVSYMMHFASGEREITGIDIDGEKITVARHCFSRITMVQFQCCEANQFQFEKYDGILLSDVLHYLGPEDQEHLLDKCLSNLRPDGVLVIRDANVDLGQKHTRTRLSEFFSTKMLGFNKTNGNELSFFSPRLIQRMAALKNMDYLEKQDSKFTSNQLYVIRNKSIVQHGSI
jgi:2-polyprenyl-3-methyl-5-hydroxy-6-metoxy-1,4-benzoquinol methylase